MYHTVEDVYNRTAQSSHPYSDASYIFGLLGQNGLLGREKIQELAAKLAIPRRKGQDLVQWLDSLAIPLSASDGDILDETRILQAISRDRGWMFRRLDPLRLDMDVVTKTLPASFARRRFVLPYAWHGKELEIVCYDPLDKELEEDLRRVVKATMRISVTPRKDIERIIQEFFDFRQSIAAAQNVLASPTVDISNLEQYVRLSSPEGGPTDAHIQRAVDHLFHYALDQRASDIHIEPKREETWVRLRIDGILHTVYRLPKVVHEAVCSRIKAISRLDVAEKRRPQDGRIKIAWKDTEAEVRVSTVPVSFGEKIVLRLQSAEILFKDLDELGFSPRDLEVYERFLARRHGIVLITGPTGSGKSTTLYSTLRHLATPEVNIVSVEDPVEMVHEGFNQIAVQPQIDVTFATILRNILRQDPDIIMIGEIRDLETAEHAVQAALTGHLVFSTLHTNDAVGAVTRLRDLGVAPYLISSTLIGVVAQRLVRLVCPACREPVHHPTGVLSALVSDPPGEGVTGWVGRGCSRCRGTGYFGRIGIYEVFPVSDEVKGLIHEGAPETALRRQAFSEGVTPLTADGFRKLKEGMTTLEEVLRVAGGG